jgi:hypothetical protein
VLSGGWSLCFNLKMELVVAACRWQHIKGETDAIILD